MNYTQLSDALVAYTENTSTEFAAQIPVFVEQAERRIYNSVLFPALRKSMTGNIQSGNKYLRAPDDFLAVYSLAVIDAQGNYEYMLNKDVNFIRQMYPNPTTDTGKPRYYSIFGPAVDGGVITTELTFILGPTPNINYGAELHFYYYPESIVTAGTSWLGDNFDTVLLYGSLVEAYTYMKGEADMMQLYNQKYMEALQLAKRLGEGLERTDAYRTGLPRVQVT